MLRFDLRTKIAGTVCILLLIAMALIVFVFVVTLQKELVEKEVLRGSNALFYLQAASSPAGGEAAPELGRFRRTVGATAVVVVGPQDRIEVSGLMSEIGSELIQMAKTAREQNRPATAFSGQTWGVYWKHAHFALMAVPNPQSGSAAAMAVSLENVYGSLRNAQKVLFIYILINGVLLTLIGMFRLSQVAVKPIYRILKRAETFQDDGSVLFVPERGNSEFNRLSRALNLMLQRISDDRETLRETIRSLEKTNIDLKKAQNDIIQAEKLASVGRLSSGIAHEIGNPIGIVLGYLELLGRPQVSAVERSEYIQRAQDEINRISTILRQLLDFSRPATGDAQIVRVHDVLTDIFEMVKVQPLMSRITVDLSLSAKNDRVYADANQLRQVFLNLVINAADAVSLLPDPESGRLTIESDDPRWEDAAGSGSEDPTLRLRFADNGPGISEEDLGNIFDPFFTTKAPGKGTGLGLSVCFMIIEKIGGRILAESRNPEGTAITIYLPLVSGDPP